MWAKAATTTMMAIVMATMATAMMTMMIATVQAE
jgi:hypothetical protein